MLKSSLPKSPFPLCFPSLAQYTCLYINFKISLSTSCHSSLHYGEYALQYIFLCFIVYSYDSFAAEHYNITLLFFCWLTCFPELGRSHVQSFKFTPAETRLECRTGIDPVRIACKRPNYWATPHAIEPRRTLLSHAAPYWATQHPIEPHPTLLSNAAPYWATTYYYHTLHVHIILCILFSLFV